MQALYSSGLRDLELLALTGADVGESQNTLAVSGPLARSVVVDTRTWQALKALGRGPGERLFELSPEGLADQAVFGQEYPIGIEVHPFGFTTTRGSV